MALIADTENDTYGKTAATTSVQLVWRRNTPQSARRQVYVSNDDTATTIWVGAGSDVDHTGAKRGIRVGPLQTQPVVCNHNAELWAITESGTADVGLLVMGGKGNDPDA